MTVEKEAEGSGWEIASTKKMISYGFGGIIGYHLSIVYTLIIFFYFEVEVGLAIGLIALSYIIYAIWNMVNDPIIGYLTDRPFFWTKRWGMRFPWIFIGYFRLGSENDESTPTSTRHLTFHDSMDSRPLRQRNKQPKVGNHCQWMRWAFHTLTIRMWTSSVNYCHIRKASPDSRQA